MANAGDNPYVTRFRRKFSGEDEMNRYVSALYEVLANTIGSDKVVLRAGKMHALKMMRSQALPDRICALQRLVFEDPTLERVTGRANYRRVIGEIEDRLADLMAQRSVEDTIEQKINAKMIERHQEYLKDLKLEALREDAGPETPATQKKLEELQQMESRGLAASAAKPNVPSSRISRAARRNAPSAVRQSALPTLIRFTPNAASSATPS